jgi:hypothetical protein
MSDAKQSGKDKARPQPTAQRRGRLPLVEFLQSLDLEGLQLVRERDTGRD